MSTSQSSSPTGDARTPPPATDQSPAQDGNGQQTIPRTKRIACLLCRKRKLRCDGLRPSCGSCLKQNHACVYDEVRKKTGPKKGYVRTLEARLAKLEKDNLYRYHMQGSDNTPNYPDPSVQDENLSEDLSQYVQELNTEKGAEQPQKPKSDLLYQGIEEPLPPSALTDRLNQEYFDKIHDLLPMIHKTRYLASFAQQNIRSQISLRYIVWALGAEASREHKRVADVFYLRARKYLERDELCSDTKPTLTLSHCQAWALVTLYELRNLYYSRAWLSIARCSRLAVMLNMARLDTTALPMHCPLPDLEWCALEERRRTFWACYSLDRQGSTMAFWPYCLNEEEIFTNLPSSEEAFNSGIKEQGVSLRQALKSGINQLGHFAASCVALTAVSRAVPHVTRHNFLLDDSEEKEQVSREFWRKHEQLELLFSTISLQLPPKYRLPAGIEIPNVIFTHITLHTGTILLNQYGLRIAKTSPPDNHLVEEELAERCYTAALMITRITRMISHMDITLIPPFVIYSLFSAARTFILHLGENSSDTHAATALEFLVSALREFTQCSAMVLSFLAHLEMLMQEHDVVFLLPLLPNTDESTEARKCVKKCRFQAEQFGSEKLLGSAKDTVDADFSSLEMNDVGTPNQAGGQNTSAGADTANSRSELQFTWKHSALEQISDLSQKTNNIRFAQTEPKVSECTSSPPECGLGNTDGKIDGTIFGGSSTMSSTGATPECVYTPQDSGNCTTQSSTSRDISGSTPASDVNRTPTRFSINVGHGFSNGIPTGLSSTTSTVPPMNVSWNALASDQAFADSLKDSVPDVFDSSIVDLLNSGLMPMSDIEAGNALLDRAMPGLANGAGHPTTTTSAAGATAAQLFQSAGPDGSQQLLQSLYPEMMSMNGMAAQPSGKPGMQQQQQQQQQTGGELGGAAAFSPFAQMPAGPAPVADGQGQRPLDARTMPPPEMYHTPSWM